MHNTSFSDHDIATLAGRSFMHLPSISDLPLYTTLPRQWLYCCGALLLWQTAHLTPDGSVSLPTDCIPSLIFHITEFNTPPCSPCDRGAQMLPVTLDPFFNCTPGWVWFPPGGSVLRTCSSSLPFLLLMFQFPHSIAEPFLVCFCLFCLFVILHITNLHILRILQIPFLVHSWTLVLSLHTDSCRTVSSRSVSICPLISLGNGVSLRDAHFFQC